MAHPVSERLQELLNFWKDQCALFSDSARIVKREAVLPPVLRNWRTLESRIFDTRILELDHSEWTWDGPMSGISLFKMYGLLPFEFFEWNRKSRRVIQLPPELARPYSIAPFHGVRMENVKLPFGSYILHLEEPLSVQEIENEPPFEIDGIWVSHLPRLKHTRCRLLRKPRLSPDEMRLSSNALRRVEIAFRRGGQEGFTEELVRQEAKWLTRVGTMPGHLVFPLFPDHRPHDFVSDVVVPEAYMQNVQTPSGVSSEEVRWRADWACRIVKIVVGWSVHMKHLPSENYTWTEPRPKPIRGHRGMSTGTITDPAHICTILRIGKMDIEKYREKHPEKEGSSFFQWPHWRSGYWRREAGTGPKAPKTVFIDSYKVREDLEPLFGVHGGKATIVTGEI